VGLFCSRSFEVPEYIYNCNYSFSSYFRSPLSKFPITYTCKIIVGMPSQKEIDGLIDDLQKFITELDDAGKWINKTAGPPVSLKVGSATVGTNYSSHYMEIMSPPLLTVLSIGNSLVDSIKAREYYHSTFSKWAEDLRKAMDEWRTEFKRLSGWLPTVPPWDVNMAFGGYAIPTFIYNLMALPEQPEFEISQSDAIGIPAGIIEWEAPSIKFNGLIMEDKTEP
jgi:hypothetical protein